MQDRVILLGKKENPYPYIAACDLYVQPSRFEGYPMTVLEALVLGKPVVSTDNGGAKELLTDGQNGTLCPISGDAIAQSVHGLITDRALLEQMRKNVERTDMDGGNRQTIAALEQLL